MNNRWAAISKNMLSYVLILAIACNKLKILFLPYGKLNEKCFFVKLIELITLKSQNLEILNFPLKFLKSRDHLWVNSEYQDSGIPDLKNYISRHTNSRLHV